jgi:formylglycine-generating enzyme required for sulfatase activity
MPVIRHLFHALPSVALLLCTSPTLAQVDACASDLNGDGIVAGADLALVLGSWGPCKTCDGDVNGDHVVDGVDLAFVLTRWGGTCAPTVTGLTPDAGPLAAGSVVTISGGHLLNAFQVTFGNRSGEIISNGATQLVVRVPVAKQASTVEVNVQTAGGSSSAGSFSYHGAPTITSATPDKGGVAGGTLVTITGTGFFGSPSVRFGTIEALAVSVQSATQVTAVAPAGPSGTVDLTLTTESGYAVTESAFSYFDVTVPAWAALLEAAPDPAFVIDASMREAILASNLAWRVRDIASGIEMLLIPPGQFLMGCSGSSLFLCAQRELPVHSVQLSEFLYVGRFEVTQEQWLAAMPTNPSFFQPANGHVGSLSRPVESVSFTAVQAYLAHTGLRLPTEAEWEFACRAGTTTAFHSMPDYPSGTNNDALVPQIAWNGPNADGQTHPVGLKAPNALGLYDMAGNVWEWVSDWYSDSYFSNSPSLNPPGPPSGTSRVVRGGSFDYISYHVRSSMRYYYDPDIQIYYLGFRVARNP